MSNLSAGTNILGRIQSFATLEILCTLCILQESCVQSYESICLSDFANYKDDFSILFQISLSVYR